MRGLMLDLLNATPNPVFDYNVIYDELLGFSLEGIHGLFLDTFMVELRDETLNVIADTSQEARDRMSEIFCFHFWTFEKLKYRMMAEESLRVAKLLEITLRALIQTLPASEQLETYRYYMANIPYKEPG